MATIQFFLYTLLALTSIQFNLKQEREEKRNFFACKTLLIAWPKLLKNGFKAKMHLFYLPVLRTSWQVRKYGTLQKEGKNCFEMTLVTYDVWMFVLFWLLVLPVKVVEFEVSLLWWIKSFKDLKRNIYNSWDENLSVSSSSGHWGA